MNRNRAIALLARPLDFLRPDENLDRRIALAGLGASVIVLVWNFATRQSLLNYEVGFVLLLASGVYLLLRRRMPSASDPSTTTERPEQGQSTRNRLHALYIVFLVLFTTSVIVLHQSLYSRPIAVLAMAAIMSGILALEIAMCRNQRSALFILLQVLALGMLLRASVYYQYSGVPGNDPWYFLDFVEKLNAQGKIGDFGDYSGFPGMPIFASSIAQVSGLGVRHSFFLVGAVESLSLVFVYLVGKAVRSENIGLLAALLLAVASQHILWGYYIIANGFCLALMPIVIFLLFAGWRSIAWGSLIVLVGFAMIVSHSITAIVLLCVLVSTFIGTHAFKLRAWPGMAGPLTHANMPDKEQATSHLRCNPPEEPASDAKAGVGAAMPSTVAMVCITAVSAVAMMLYWRYSSGTYERILANIYVGASSVATGPATTTVAASTTLGRSLWENAPVLCFMFLAIVGAFFMLRQRGRRAELGMPFVLLTLLMPFWVLVLYNTFRGSMPERWIPFVLIFSSIPASAIIMLMLTGGRRWVGASGVILMIVLSMLMVSNRHANVATVFDQEQVPRIAFTESEVETVEMISSMRANSNAIYADAYYNIVFRFHGHVEDRDNLSAILGMKETPAEGDIVVVRQELRDNPFFACGEGVLDKLGDTKYEDLVRGDEEAIICSCGTVKVLQYREAEEE